MRARAGFAAFARGVHSRKAAAPERRTRSDVTVAGESDPGPRCNLLGYDDFGLNSSGGRMDLSCSGRRRYASAGLLPALASLR